MKPEVDDEDGEKEEAETGHFVRLLYIFIVKMRQRIEQNKFIMIKPE